MGFLDIIIGALLVYAAFKGIQNGLFVELVPQKVHFEFL